MVAGEQRQAHQITWETVTGVFTDRVIRQRCASECTGELFWCLQPLDA